MSPAIVAIDGPAGAGKSTVARQLARRLGFTMIDTGAIYRSVALAARRAGIEWDDDEGLRKLLDAGLGLQFLSEPAALEQRVLLHGQDVTQAIRTPEITRGASVVSARPVVREKLLGLQRELGLKVPKGAVLEGRDIGTIVFPDAAVKFFLTASDEARAQRRRDKDDRERAIAPLRAASDAIVIETTGLDLAEVVDQCHSLAAARLSQL